MARPRKSDAKPQNAKRRKQDKPYSPEEWRELPIVLDCIQTARALNCCARWVSDHAPEVGGIKIAGRWKFSKATIGKLVGIE